MLIREQEVRLSVSSSAFFLVLILYAYAASNEDVINYRTKFYDDYKRQILKCSGDDV
jgi:hypothetical protein